jgi:hypothetical protein
MKTGLTFVLTTLCSVSAFGLHGTSTTTSAVKSIGLMGVKKAPMIQSIDIHGNRHGMVRIIPFVLTNMCIR